MHTWRVTCTIQVDEWQPDATAALRTALPRGAYVEHSSGEGRVTAIVEVASQSVGGATQKVTSDLHRALKEIGHGGRPVTLRTEGLDLLAGPRADLAGAKEAAEILGVARPRVNALAQAAGFPTPLALLASGPVWDAAELRRYAAVRPRTGGRPRKDA